VSFGPQQPTALTACVGCTALVPAEAGIAEQHRFIIGEVVQQVLISLDEGLLLLRVQLARHGFRLAMFHAKPVQQRDQAGSALIRDAAFLLDPGTNRARRPRQRLGDPGFQLVLLHATQAACTAFVAETGQSLDPVFFIQAMPCANRVVVD
jgi:hypothetical protein